MPTPGKNEIVLFTDDELPTAEAEVLSAIEKVLKQPTPDLLAIPVAILSVELSWRTNLRQATEAKSFEANQSLKSLQEKEQNARNRFPDQAIAAGSADQLVTLQQQLREEMASIASQREDLETKRNHAQSDLEVLFADLEKGEKLTAQFQKPAIVNANISLSRPTVNALSRLFTISPVKEEATLVLSPGKDLLTTARDTIAASRTRTLAPATDDLITIEVERRKPGRPKLSDTPAPVHLNVLKILEEEGVDLSTLTSTNAQGIAVSLKALLLNDVGIEKPTLDDMEQALRGIVRGDYREVLDRRRTLLTLDGLAKPKTAPAKIETLGEPATLVKKIEETTPITKAVGRDGQPFDPKPKELKPILVIDDDDPLALIFTKIAKNDYLEITEPGLLAAAMTGKKARSEGRVSATARKTAMEKLQTNIIALTDTAKRQGILTLDQLADSNDIKIPDEMRTFFRNKCQNVPIANLAVIEGQIAAGYHQEKAKTLDQLALKLQKRKLSGN